MAKYTPEYVEQISGVPAADLRRAARLYGAAKAAAIVYAMGITQHTTGTDNVKSLANLAMLCGNVGIRRRRGQSPPGAKQRPGGLRHGRPAQCLFRLSDGDRSETAAEDGGGLGSPQSAGWVGLTMTEMMPAIPEGRIKALYIFGENPVISDADTDQVINALKHLDFLVVQDIFLTETGKLADVVLPAASFAEKDGTFTNTERRVARVRQVIPPVGDSKPDWQIIAEISRRLGHPMPFADPQAIFDEIRRVTPSYAGITYDRLENEGGLQWPCPITDHPGTVYLHRGQFSRGRGHFFAIDYREPAEMPDADYPLVLTTGRVLYQYHTGTMSRRAPGLVEKAPECRVEIAAGDAATYDIAEGEMVRVKSRRGELVARALVSTKAVPGTIFIPFHYYEAAVNKLTIAALDPVAKIPEYKVCAVRIEKVRT